MIHEKFKTNRKMLKKWHYLQQQLESHFWLGKKLKFGFFYFYKSYRKFNFLSKKHQFRINWNFEQQVMAKIRNRCRR